MKVWINCTVYGGRKHQEKGCFGKESLQFNPDTQRLGRPWDFLVWSQPSIALQNRLNSLFWFLVIIFNLHVYSFHWTAGSVKVGTMTHHFIPRGQFSTWVGLPNEPSRWNKCPNLQIPREGKKADNTSLPMSSSSDVPRALCLMLSIE